MEKKFYLAMRPTTMITDFFDKSGCCSIGYLSWTELQTKGLL